MKKVLAISAISLIFFSCSNLQMQQKQNEIIVPLKTEDLPQEKVLLTTSTIDSIYSTINKEFNSNSVRNYPVSKLSSPLEVYAGESLNINGVNANRIKIISAPVKSGYSLTLNDGVLRFRSLYQGDYIAELYNEFTYVATIKIKNKLKYNFTEKDNYDIILNSYKNEDISTMEKSIKLYTYAFPNQSKQKDISFMILTKNSLSPLFVNERLKFLKDNFMLTESEKINLLTLESSYPNFKYIDSYYLDYNRSYLDLNRKIVEVIKKKNNATVQELQFLEKFYGDIQETDLAYLIGSLYSKNGITSKANQYLSLGGSDVISSSFGSSLFSSLVSNNQSKENNSVSNEEINELSKGIDALNRKSYTEALMIFNKYISSNASDGEAYFYRGKTYFLMNNFAKAIEDLSLANGSSIDLSETYYYLGVSYHKTGNTVKAQEFLRKSRENNPSSTWGRKSSIYLLKL